MNDLVSGLSKYPISKEARDIELNITNDISKILQHSAPQKQNMNND
jgi:hypothetical protein